jgi:cell division protein FtsQ
MSRRENLTRSEQMRKRRKNALQPKRSQKNRTAGVKTVRRDLPPVTTRGVVNEYALEHHKKMNRRVFNMSTGFAIPRLREGLFLPRIEFGWRPLSLLLVILLGTGLYLLWTLPNFRISSASTTFTGNTRIPEEELEAMLEINGQSVFLLLPDQLEQQMLLNHHELASVDLTVTLPNQVSVNVAERQPLIKWQQGEGYTWIDENGVAFRPRGEAQDLILVQAFDVPPTPYVADTSEPVPFISPEMAEAIQMLGSAVPAGVPITYEQDSGLGWSDSRGWKVELGKPQDIALKMRVFEILSAWLEQRGIYPVLINVAYPKTPYYRMEP